MEGSNGNGNAQATKAETTKTEYIVLRADAECKAFTFVAPIAAHSPAKAIEGIGDRALKDDEQEGFFIAVPARSWKPMKFTVEVERKTKVAEV